MPDVQHRDLKPGVASGIHVAHAWSVTSEAARTGLAVVAGDDEGKVCRQVVGGAVTYWILRSVTGGVGTWAQIDAPPGGMTSQQIAQLDAATADATALKAPTYIVQTASGAIDNERVLVGADGVTIDYATAGQAIVRGPTIPAAATPGQVAALRTPTYIVQTATTELDAERALLCTAPLTADWATAGQVTLAMPAATTSAPGHMTAAHATALGAATSGVAALRTPVYLVQTATAELSAERVVSCTAPLVADWATAGQVTFSMPAATTSAAGHMTAAHATSLAAKADKRFTIVANAAASLTLALAHEGALIACTNASAPVIVIPRDSTLNLPVGYTVSVVLTAAGENLVRINSEVMTGTYGTPARNASGYSDYESTPYGLFAPAFQPMTLTKIAADSWLITGHYAA